MEVNKEFVERGYAAIRSTADDLRMAGLSVAIHNDYLLNGKPHTFWLMTKDFDGIVRAFKGEGETDQIALDQIRAAFAQATDQYHHAPMCPANHYHGKRAPTSVCNCGAVTHKVMASERGEVVLFK